jgi:hypothetical protein
MQITDGNWVSNHNGLLLKVEMREKTISYKYRFKRKNASGRAYLVAYGKNAEQSVAH